MDNKHQETGVIVLIKDTLHVSDKFKKREFVIKIETNNPEYPEHVMFEFIQDKVDLLDSHQVGQEITVHFNVKGRHWKEDKYFNTLQAWRTEPASGLAPQQENPYGQAPAPYQQAPAPAPAPHLQPGTVEDDPTVPF